MRKGVSSVILLFVILAVAFLLQSVIESVIPRGYFLTGVFCVFVSGFVVLWWLLPPKK